MIFLNRAMKKIWENTVNVFVKKKIAISNSLILSMPKFMYFDLLNVEYCFIIHII